MTYLYWYKILFMTELLIAEGMLTWSAPRRHLFPLRVIAVIAVCYAVAFLYPLFGWSYTWYGSLVMFFVLFCFTVCGLWLCFKVSFLNVLFCAVTAYAIQHVSYEIFSLVNIVLFGSDVFTDTAYGSGTLISGLFSGVGSLSFIIYLFVYTCVYFISYIVLHKSVEQGITLKFRNTSVLGFTTFVLIINIVFSSLAQHAMPAGDVSWQIFVCAYNILCCVIIFYMHCSMVKKRNAEYENEVISEMFRQYQKNYLIREESIRLINRKCHDFKHQIRTFASGHGIVDTAAVNELSDIISIYDTNIHTGNGALDIILTEKSLLCHEKCITLTCLAEGHCISFMSNGEVYALFGNILDNAIEAVSKVEERDKRCINLHVTHKGGIVVIRSDNYYSGAVNFSKDGLPKTTKGDEFNHGLGMKSIRALAEAYGGTLHITASEGIFCISIIIPHASA